MVVTEDAVLATQRGNAQDVKKLVDRLKAAGRHEAVAHNRAYRPWGFYESLIQGDRFQVKRIVVAPGQRLSLQKHFHRAEHWVVVKGTALVTRDDIDHIAARERKHLRAARRRAPAGEPRQDPADVDREVQSGFPIWAKTTSCGSRTPTAAPDRPGFAAEGTPATGPMTPG